MAGIVRQILAGSGLECWSEADDERAALALLSGLGGALIAVSVNLTLAGHVGESTAQEFGEAMALYLAQAQNGDLPFLSMT